MKKIYFAGSVGKGDWRNNLAVEATGRIMSNGYAQYTTPSGGKFIYGGPFAISDDHGCFHEGDHGFGPAACEGSFDENGEEGSGQRCLILPRCEYQIRSCDALLVNITKPDCYGTYYEIGYASACGKPIFIHCPVIIKKNIQDTHHAGDGDGLGDDLWFIKQSATLLTALEIPQELLVFETKPNYKEYLQSPHWKTLTAAKREEAGNKCQLCNDGEVTLHVHHRTYENIYKETLKDLIVLCENCHKKFHGKD